MANVELGLAAMPATGNKQWATLRIPYGVTWEEYQKSWSRVEDKEREPGLAADREEATA